MPRYRPRRARERLQLRLGTRPAAGSGGDAVFVHLDVTSAARWRDALKAAADGDDKLDVLASNAGLWPGGRVQETTKEECDLMFEVIANAVSLGIRANSLHPDPVETDLLGQVLGGRKNIAYTPLGRIGVPLDIAFPAQYLVCDGSGVSRSVEDEPWISMSTA